MSDYLSFRLPDSFIEEYKDKKPPFGFPDAAGNSVGEVVFARTYSRKKDDGTKEQWWEVCKRITEGTFSVQKNHCSSNRLPWNGQKALATAKDFYDRLFNLKWSPPGRGLFAMGTYNTVGRNSSNALQNCAVMSSHDMPKHNPAKPFIFLMEASMNGIGVGFDTRGSELGIEVRKPDSYKEETFVIPDTREGWAESTGKVINAYLANKPLPVFDYSEIRPYGAEIKTFGGTASGPDPLISLHKKLEEVFESRVGDTVDSRLIVDIANLIGVAVVSGNVRRSAELALGKVDDTDFINLKNPSVFPDRQSHAFMSNNSVDAEVGDDLSHIIENIKLGGEPGVIWMDQARNYGRMKDGYDGKDYRAAAMNPCLTGDSLLLTEDGYVSFYDAYKNREPQNILVDSRVTYVESEDGEEHSENWKIEHKTGSSAVMEKASEVFMTKKNADVVKVTTRAGYVVRLTPDHLVATRHRGMVPAEDLSEKDEILVTAGTLPGYSIVGREPETIDEIECALMGLIASDGYVNRKVGQTDFVRVSFFNDGREKHVERVSEWINTLYKHYAGKYLSDSGKSLKAFGITTREDKKQTDITSTFLAVLLRDKYGFTKETKQVVPGKVMRESRSSKALFYLAGVAFGDGTVKNKFKTNKAQSVGISQSNLDFLRQIQLILLSNGIESRISSSSPGGTHMFPLKDGSKVERTVKENFYLSITTSKKDYVDYVGFLGSHNDEKARKIVKPSNKKPVFTTKVTSVEPDGVEDVYCLREPKRRILAANGISMRRCAEQPLEPYECCTLCDVYLHNAESYEDFVKTLKVAFLYAKTVTLMPTDWPETNSVMQRNRRIGTSLSGVADFVDNHGLPMLRKWTDSGFEEIKRLDNIYSEWLCIRESIRTNTVKPGGTTGVVAGTSPGAHWTPGGKFFIRRVTFDKNDPIVKQFQQAGYTVEDSFYTPDTSVVVEFPIKSGAQRSESEVTIFEKVALAAEMQHHWSDNSVSVTVSFDAETEAQHINTILNMYEGKLKSVSFLPMGGSYQQMPYEPITEEEYEEYRVKLLPVDLSPVYGLEAQDATGEKYCTTDSCEISAFTQSAKEQTENNATEL